MNFATLKSRLLAQIGRAPSDLCYELVTAEINEHVRLASMQATVTFDAVAEYTLPTDFLEDVSVYVESGGVRQALESQDPSAFDAGWTNLHYPAFYAISDGVMRINGYSSGTINLRYYQEQADLSADSDTNTILTDHPAIYVYGVLAHHAALTQNPEALGVHFPAYERAISMARRADNAKRAGGNMVGPRPRTAP